MAFGTFDTAIATPAPDENCQSRECRYFRHYFALANGKGHDAEFAEAYGAVRSEWEKVNAVSPDISLGTMLALVRYESLAKLGFFNTRDDENSFAGTGQLDLTRPFVDQPLAYYSYQFGIVPIHMSLLRPCKKETVQLRKLFDEIARKEGFAVKPEDLESVRARWKVACAASVVHHVEQPGPQAVDYYILQAHMAPFDVPVNEKSPHAAVTPAALKAFPFFSPRVTAPLLFNVLARNANGIHGEGDTIKAFGGGDGHYATQELQAKILRSWLEFR